jgi:hypothetical protein
VDTHLPPYRRHTSWTQPTCPALPAFSLRVPPAGAELPVPQQDPAPVPAGPARRRPAWLRTAVRVASVAAALGAAVVLVTGVDRGHREPGRAAAEAPDGFTTFRDDRRGVALALPSGAAVLELSKVDGEAAAAWVDDVLHDLPDDVRLEMGNRSRSLAENHGVLLSIDRGTGTTVVVVEVPDSGPLPDRADRAMRQRLAERDYEVRSSEMTSVSGYPAVRLTAVAVPGGDPDEVGFFTEVLVVGRRNAFVVNVTSLSLQDPTVEAIVGSLQVA